MEATSWRKESRGRVIAARFVRDKSLRGSVGRCLERSFPETFCRRGVGPPEVIIAEQLRRRDEKMKVVRDQEIKKARKDTWREKGKRRREKAGKFGKASCFASGSNKGGETGSRHFAG